MVQNIPRHLKDLKSSIDNWAEITVNNTERDVIKGTLRGVLDTSVIIDNFTNWLLAGTGATAILLISNLSTVINFIGESNYKLALACLCIAFLFGVLEKFAFLQISISRVAENNVEKAILASLEKHEETEKQINQMANEFDLPVSTNIDFNKVLKGVVAAFPRFYQKKVDQLLRKSFENPLYSYQVSLRSYMLQSIWCGFEIMSFIAFVVVVALGV